MEIGRHDLCCTVMFYLLFPSVAIIVMSFSAGPSLQFPPSALSLQWCRSFFNTLARTEATWTSIQLAVAVAVLSTMVGMLAAYGPNHTVPRVPALSPGDPHPDHHSKHRYRHCSLSRIAQIWTDRKSGIILTHSIGATAYVVVMVSATLANFDRRLELAAKICEAIRVELS